MKTTFLHHICVEFMTTYLILIYSFCYPLITLPLLQMVHLIICCTLIYQLQRYIAGFVFMYTNPIRPIRCHVDCLNPHALPNGFALSNLKILNLKIYQYFVRDIPFKNMFFPKNIFGSHTCGIYP